MTRHPMTSAELSRLVSQDTTGVTDGTFEPEPMIACQRAMQRFVASIETWVAAIQTEWSFIFGSLARPIVAEVLPHPLAFDPDTVKEMG